jgi:hypothetical protein
MTPRLTETLGWGTLSTSLTTFLGEERAEEEKPKSCAQEHNSDNHSYIIFAKKFVKPKNYSYLFLILHRCGTHSP